jgi:hypothetical protein
LTAVLGEKGHQRRHALKVSGVVDETPFLTRGHQSRMTQLLQVKGEGCGGHFQLLAYLSSGHALWSDLYKQPEYRKARFLGKRSKRGDSGLRFHVSNCIEALENVKAGLLWNSSSLSYCHRPLQAGKQCVDGNLSRKLSADSGTFAYEDALNAKRTQNLP